MIICAFCRYSNDKKNNKCRHCTSDLIPFEPLSEQEEAYWYRENLNRAYKIRLKPRITVQEQLEKERKIFAEEWESIFTEIVGVLNRVQW